MLSVREVLAPYSWRALSPEAVCRLALAAIDSAQGPEESSSVSGAAGGVIAGPDERVEVLVEFLRHHRWRSLTVGGLSRQLVTAMDTWQQERAWFDIRLTWLLQDGG